MYVTFYYMLFAWTTICLLLSFIRSDGFDARVAFSLAGVIMFACMALGAFGIEVYTPASDEVTVYSPTFAYVCMFMGTFMLLRLLILVTGMLTAEKMTDNVAEYSDID